MPKRIDDDELMLRLKKSEAENKVLSNRIKELEEQILKERRQTAIDKIKLQWHEGQFTAAAADYLINPDPIKIHGSHKGRGLDFSIKLIEIIAIKSNGRIKEIFLREPLRPIEGGAPHEAISMNSESSDFNAALFTIQKRFTHLQRVSKSIAVNIHHYDLGREKELVLNISPVPKSLPENLKKVKTDKFFDLTTFHQRKFEFQEIERYRKKPPVP